MIHTKILENKQGQFQVLVACDETKMVGATAPYFKLKNAQSFEHAVLVEICEFCGDSGVVCVNENVYGGEPHQANVGVRRCICKLKEDEEE